MANVAGVAHAKYAASPVPVARLAGAANPAFVAGAANPALVADAAHLVNAAGSAPPALLSCRYFLFRFA